MCTCQHTPEKGSLTLKVSDETLIVRKSVDPYVLTPSNHDMGQGALINYTISVCALPKADPTDIVLSVDSSGSIIENDVNVLTNIDGGITSFVKSMKSSPRPKLRIGLVNWDSEIDDSVPPMTNYDEVANASHRLRANSRELTMYDVGMDGSIAAFNTAPEKALGRS
jgi:hypothetical protein